MANINIDESKLNELAKLSNEQLRALGIDPIELLAARRKQEQELNEWLREQANLHRPSMGCSYYAG